MSAAKLCVTRLLVTRLYVRRVDVKQSLTLQLPHALAMRKLPENQEMLPLPGLSFAVVGWFRRFRLPPPPLFLFRSVGLRFSFPLPFQGLPALGQVCLCWCLLLPSSFAFPSLRPG